MRFFSFLSVFLLPLQFLLAQNEVITLTNPSFEGIAHAGGVGKSLPEGWYDCGFPMESPPDVHPMPDGGTFRVTQAASDGETYLGLVVRDNDTWEMVSQRLSSPLKTGSFYSFSIDLCRASNYMSMSRLSGKPVNYTTPISLRIWGGIGYCNRSEMLAVSELITDSKWKRYDFTLSPSKDFDYIVLEAYYKTPTPTPYNGNLLMDNASGIVEE